jgi:histone deacetylase complex regulatory component SIN3
LGEGVIMNNDPKEFIKVDGRVVAVITSKNYHGLYDRDILVNLVSTSTMTISEYKNLIKIIDKAIESALDDAEDYIRDTVDF